MIDNNRQGGELPEIEITPEMVEAGELELCGFTDFFESADEGAQKIFRAMILAAPERLRQAFYKEIVSEEKTPR